MLDNAGVTPSRSEADIAPARRRLARIDGRSRQARRIKTLMASYRERLGDNVEPDRVRRCAELVAIAEDLRAAKLRGEAVDPNELFKCEGYADRAVRALGLDRPREPRYVPLRERLLLEAEQQLPTLGEMLKQRDQHG